MKRIYHLEINFFVLTSLRNSENNMKVSLILSLTLTQTQDRFNTDHSATLSIFLTRRYCNEMKGITTALCINGRTCGGKSFGWQRHIFQLSSLTNVCISILINGVGEIKSVI